jgi:UDP-2,3-diacylglucosamine pyrophosphatase LpxH
MEALMLVVISDLHLVDGTAGGKNLTPEAFREVFLCDINSLAEHNKAKEIKIVLLGDTIDLLRTKKWSEAKLEDRPWGLKGLADLDRNPEIARESDTARQCSATENICMDILREIIRVNRPIFEFFKTIKREFPSIEEDRVELIYVPGNHDRLVNYYPSLREIVAQELGITNAGTAASGESNSNWTSRFSEYFKSEDYGVLAHHGHKHDEWNYGGSTDAVPIGDVITTEIVARIPRVFRREMEPRIPEIARAAKVDEPAARAKLNAEIAVLTEEIDNIRPLTSIFLYLRRKGCQFSKSEEHGKAYSEALNRTLCTVLRDFWKIPFVKKWTWHLHNLGVVCSGVAQVAREWLASCRGLIPDPYKDRYAKDAQLEHNESEEAKRPPFILYGHTHSPAQVPLRRDTNKLDPDAIYINTGTWRPRIIQTVDGQEYVYLKTMTYAVFYGPEDDPPNKKSGTRSFDVWTGWQCKQCTDGACLVSMASDRATF